MQGLNLSQIAKLFHRYTSSISREWKRHLREGNYSLCHAQKSYYIAKSHCGRKRILEIDRNLSNTVKHLFLEYQWSTEEIEGRLRLEYGKAVISYQTSYRAIYKGHFDDNSLSHGARGVIRKLRHRGKKRHIKGYVKNRRKISISHTIQERPKDANNRTRIGDWEANTVAGKTGKACLVTLTERYSRFLKIQKVACLLYTSPSPRDM